jgi:hypothetical protein
MNSDTENYFSQNDEQKLIEKYFSEPGILFDIGASDGITFSNSRKMLLNGWNGFLVEPGKKSYNKLHNLYKDNGIKLFDNLGYKISDEDEKAIESLLDKDLDTELVASEKVGRAYRLRESSGRYIEFVKNCFSNNFMLSNLKIVLD